MARVEKNAQAHEEIVILDVGGTKFSTTKTHLLRFPNTYFTGLLGGGPWKPQADGSYFIDTDSMGFEYLLSFLRNGRLDTEGLDQDLLRRIREHFDYFCVPFPEKGQAIQNHVPSQLEWWKEMCSGRLTIEGRILSKNTYRDSWDAGVLINAPNCPRFRVRVIERANTGVTIGLAIKSRFQINQNNLYNPGYYLGLTGTILLQYKDHPKKYDFDTYAASPINNGSIIEVGYDKKKGTISFVIDGVNQGIAYNIPEDELDEPLYPAVNIGHPEAKLELL